MARTDWQHNGIVTEADMNQLGQQVNGNTEGLGVLEGQIEETEASAKAYTDQQIAFVTATGIPKLVTYPYVLTATQVNQTDFEIPLETFVSETDTVTVAQNSTVLSTVRYSLVKPKTVRLAEGVSAGTEIFIQVWKNVPIGPDGAISGAVLANGTVTDEQLSDDPGQIKDVVAAHLANDASLTTKGHVQLSSSTTSTSTTLAATASAVKLTMDKAESAVLGGFKKLVDYTPPSEGYGTLSVTSIPSNYKFYLIVVQLAHQGSAGNGYNMYTSVNGVENPNYISVYGLNDSSNTASTHFYTTGATSPGVIRSAVDLIAGIEKIKSSYAGAAGLSSLGFRITNATFAKGCSIKVYGAGEL